MSFVVYMIHVINYTLLAAPLQMLCSSKLMLRFYHLKSRHPLVEGTCAVYEVINF